MALFHQTKCQMTSVFFVGMARNDSLKKTAWSAKGSNEYTMRCIRYIN